MYRLVIVALSLFGCSSPEAAAPAPDAGAPAPVAEVAPAPPPPLDLPAIAPPAPTSPRAHSPLQAGEEIAIPAGVVHVGSRPGTEGRRPEIEADLIEVEVPAFSIDRLPYPNDPERAPMTRVSQARAAELCAADGKRLCDELEWERACRGDSLDAFPGGVAIDVDRCGLDPLACASRTSVVSMGVHMREWTASPASRGLTPGNIVVRGGAADAEATEHRCGFRRSVSADTESRTVGFRCCRGPSPGLAYPTEEEMRRIFYPEAMEVDRVREVLAAVPEVASLAEGFELLTMADMDRALGRGDRTRAGLSWALTDGQVIKWYPVQGEEAWVIGGHTQGHGLIAVVYPLPDGTFAHAASFILEADDSPIAIAWARGYDHEILWSTCWSCGGEGGAILYEQETGRIVIVQR